jgi:hypothetical protein
MPQQPNAATVHTSRDVPGLGISRRRRDGGRDACSRRAFPRADPHPTGLGPWLGWWYSRHKSEVSDPSGDSRQGSWPLCRPPRGEVLKAFYRVNVRRVRIRRTQTREFFSARTQLFAQQGLASLALGRGWGVRRGLRSPSPPFRGSSACSWVQRPLGCPALSEPFQKNVVRQSG